MLTDSWASVCNQPLTFIDSRTNLKKKPVWKMNFQGTRRQVKMTMEHQTLFFETNQMKCNICKRFQSPDENFPIWISKVFHYFFLAWLSKPLRHIYITSLYSLHPRLIVCQSLFFAISKWKKSLWKQTKFVCFLETHLKRLKPWSSHFYDIAIILYIMN